MSVFYTFLDTIPFHVHFLRIFGHDSFSCPFFANFWTRFLFMSTFCEFLDTTSFSCPFFTHFWSRFLFMSTFCEFLDTIPFHVHFLHIFGHNIISFRYYLFLRKRRSFEKDCLISPYRAYV